MAYTIGRPAGVAGPQARVLAIYPTAAQLPRNHLRFYVYFSEPMSEGWATKAVSVRRLDTGERLEGVLLALDPELWDGSRRRLTLLLDPGRLKRGLIPNAQAGYPLCEGQSIALVIDPAFRDGQDRPLAAGAQRAYGVGPDVRRRVVPALWESQCPTLGSRQPLAFRFDRPLDHALLQHSLGVWDGAGRPVAGEPSVDEGESRWCFVPRSPWEAGPYRLAVNTRLEDLAGNSVARLFDRDLTRVHDDPLDGAQVFVEFAGRPRRYDVDVKVL